MTARRDADGVLDLFPGQMQRAPGDDRRNERSQGRVMPAAFANSGKRRLAEAHLELVSENESDDEFLAITPGALASGQGRGKNVGRMRRVLLPVDVVVVHAADHQRVGQRRGHGVDLLAGADHGGRAATGNFVEHLQRDLYIVLLVSAQRAAHGIQQKALGLVDRFLARAADRSSPAAQRDMLRGNGFFGRGSLL